MRLNSTPAGIIPAIARQIRPDDDPEATADLVEQINAEHKACLDSANDALDHAMRCGELLIEAKQQCHHGEWSLWLADSFTGSDSTARAYMRIGRNREAIEAKRQATADLTLERALQYIAPRREAAPNVEKLIDDALNGPLCFRDFRGDWLRWLTTKIVHQLKLPAVAGFALTTDIETDPPMVRVVSDDELLEALQILAPYATSKAALSTINLTPKDCGVLSVVLAYMVGALLNEVQHRYGPLHGRKIGKRRLSHKHHEAEASAALKQFGRAVNDKLAEFEGTP